MSGRRRATAPEVMRAVGLRERGWKLLDIAGAFGVSEATVSRWCRGLTRRQVTGRLITRRRSEVDDARVCSSPAGRGDANASPFERHVDPDSILAPDERGCRAAHARRAYTTTLALKASPAAEKRCTARAAQEPDPGTGHQ